MDTLAIWFSILVAITGCGQFFSVKKNAQSASKSPEAVVKTTLIEGNHLSGIFKDKAGNLIDLKELSDKPVVLMFAQKRCQGCQEEALEILSSFRYEEKKSDVIHFITVMVQAKSDRVIDQWKLNLQRNSENTLGLVPEWLHGIDSQNHDLYYRYFDPERTGSPLTPAMVLFYPYKKELMTFTGRGEIPEGQSLTNYLNEQGFYWEQKK